MALTTATTTTTSRAIQARLWYELKQAPSEGWIDRVSGGVLSSNQKTETYRGLGSTPAMRKWVGSRAPDDLTEITFAITNDRFETSLRIYHDERLYEQSGQLSRRISDLVGRYNQHWNKLASDLIKLGDTTTGYDGQFFFDTDHSTGASGNQDNDLTTDITAPTAPTPSEFEAALFAGIEAMRGYVDDQGEPMHEEQTSFTVMIPTNMLRGAAGALGATSIGEDRTSAQTNIILTLGGYTFDLVANPRLDAEDTKWYLFANDGRSFIRQQVEGPMITSKAEGSEYEHDTGHHEHGVWAVRNIGFGNWQSAVLHTFT